MSRCPSSQQLEHLLDETLSDGEHRAVSLHVSECAACQASLENMTADTAVVGEARSVVLRRGSSPGAIAASLNPFLVRLKELSPVAVLNVSRKAGQGDSPGVAPTTPGSGIPSIPGYELVSELGRGGMGVVYKAVQVGLHRPVALKMILAGPHAGPRDLARFSQEAEAVARLRHPNIVQIYDIGEAEGIPYFALEFVEEGSLVQRLRGDPQPVEPTVRLIETLAQAIHFAHQHGIIHRDLKPANILLQRGEGLRNRGEGRGARGEKDADSSLVPRPSPLAPIPEPLAPIPKITDFGLAKRIDEQGPGSQSGEIVGTPSYMAPEQAAGKTNLVGPATDVYALGAILYEMLTGRPPFKGATAVDTVVQVLHVEPVRPSRLRPSLPADLETICLKCLLKEPSRRYASAEALADDLQRFRKDKPILARPVGLPERVWKAARRRPLTAALLAGMILSALLGFAGVTWQWQEAARARDIALGEKRDKEVERLQAEYARADAVEERKKTRTALYFSRIAQSQLQWRVNDVGGAINSLNKCVPLADQEDRRGWEWYYLLGQFHSDLFTLYHTHGGEGGNAVFHPDGRAIAAVVGGQATDTGMPGEVRVWDARSGALLHSLRAPGTAHRLAYRPDGSRLALATTDGRILVWDTATGKELSSSAPHGQLVAGVAFSPDGQVFASAGWDETVNISSAGSGQVLRVLKGHTGRVQSVAFHPDGKSLVSGGWDTTVRLWDLESGQEIRILFGHKSPVYGVAYSPDGRLLATAGSNGNLKIWDLASGRVVQSLTTRTGAVLSSAFSPDGRYLAYSGSDGTVRIWDVELAEEAVIYRGHTAPVESVQFSPDGQRLVTSSPAQGAVKIWDLTRHPEYATLARVRSRADQVILVRDLLVRPESAASAQTGPDLEALAFHADGKRLVSVAVGGKLQTWDAASGVLLEQRALPLCEELVSPAVLATFSTGGERLAGRAREDERLVKTWDVATGAEAAAFKGHTMPVFCIRFSHDGRRLVTCGCDVTRPERPHEIKVWDAATGAALSTRTGHGLVFSAAFSPDGRWLALGGQEGAVLLIDGAGSGSAVSIAGLHSAVTALAFSADSRLLAAAGVADRTFKLWDLEGFDPTHDPAPRTFHSPAAPPFLCDLVFSPDGRRLAGISRDLVKLWDVATGHETLTLRGAPQRHWDPAFNPRLAFSPDGKRLVGTNWDESISMWDAGVQADEGALAQHQAARRQAADARAVYWHLQEAEDCLEHLNRSAALFHLRRLGSAPLSEPLQARRDKLAAQLGP